MAQGSTNASGVGGSGVLPAWWLEEKIVTAGERIEQYAPIEYRQYPGEYKLEGQVVNALPVSVGASMSGDGQYLALRTATEPYLHLYREVEGIFMPLTLPSDLPLGPFGSAVFSRDGRYFLACHQSLPAVFLYKVQDGTFTRLPDMDIPIPAAGAVAAISPDNSAVAVLCVVNETALLVYRLENDALTKLVTTGAVHNSEWTASSSATSINRQAAVEFSPDGEYLAVLSYGKPGTSAGYFFTAFRRSGDGYGLLDATSFPRLTSPGSSTFFSFSFTGKYFAMTVSDTIITERNEDGSGYTQIHTLSTDIGSAYYGTVAFAPNDDWFVTGRYNAANFHAIRDYGDGYFLAIPNMPALAPPNAKHSIQFTADGSKLYVFSTSTDAPCIVYATGEKEFALNMRDVNMCKYMALNAYGFYGMGIALSAANKGEQLRIGLFGPVNRAMAGGAL